MKMTALVAFLVVTAAATLTLMGRTRSSKEPLRLNDIQVVGSHNSYKRAMPPERLEQLHVQNPEAAISLDYEHEPLEDQLDLGLRKLELDVFWDPDGDLYPWPEGVEPSPGLRVMHIQNLDDRSHCPTLESCLRQLLAWSEDHPDHLPVAVTLNAKDQVIEQPGFVHPLPFDETAWRTLDSILRQVLDERLIEPAEVFVDGELRWPTLDDARGGFLFVLDERGDKRADYVSRWRERAMFANLDPGEPGAAFLIVNDPIDDFQRIRRLVRSGYLVRTRADADTVEARTGDTTRRDRAFASGAHFVSTDYYRPAKFGTGYVVELPGLSEQAGLPGLPGLPGGGVARCNPVRFPEGGDCPLPTTAH